MDVAMTTTYETTGRVPLAERFAQIPLTQLQESVHNPRTHFDRAKLLELAESIRQKGIVEPLVVRDRDTFSPSFEIVAGARRFRAAQIAGLDEVPCIVRDYSDEDVLEIFVIENLQRDDLSPLEQARGFQQLLTANADRFSVATIAGKVGMSTAWVWDRLKLLDLVPEAQALLEQGRISVGHAIVIARQKPDDQARIIDSADGGLWQDEESGLDFDEQDARGDTVDDYQDLKPCSIRELEHWIAEHIRFDVAHMAQAVPLQFEDLKNDVDAARTMRGKKAVISITFDHFTQPSARDEADRTYGPQSWRRADGQQDSKECHHSVLGVVVAGPQRGRAFDVCIAREKCDVHFKAEIEAKKKADAAKAKGDTKTAKKVEKKQEQSWERKERDRKERAAIWNPMKPHVVAAAIDQVRKQSSLTPAQVRHLDDQHEIYLSPRELKELLGKTWHEQLAAAVLVSEITSDYSDSFEEFVENVAKPFGLDMKPLLAARDAHSPKPEADTAAPPAKKTRGRK